MAKKYELTLPVFIVKPLAHSNGGWYGSKVIQQCILEEALKFVPSGDIDSVSHSPYDGRVIDYERICTNEDPNSAIHTWNDEIYKWHVLS